MVVEDLLGPGLGGEKRLGGEVGRIKSLHNISYPTFQFSQTSQPFSTHQVISSGLVPGVPGP